MRRHDVQRAGPGALLLLVACSVQAQTAAPDEDRVRALPQVDVVHRTPLPGFDVPRSLYPGNAQQATDGAIERAGAGTLMEFMNRRLQGVSVNEVQGNPSQVDLLYRGQRLSPLLGSAPGLSLWLDGVRMNQPFGDVVSWDLLPDAAIAGLALVPGSNPLYGLNTLGGSLMLTTKSGLTHAGTELDISAGSFGRRRIELGQGRQWAGGWHAYLAVTAQEDAGWRAQSSGRLGNVYLKLGRQQGEDGWSASLLHAGSDLRGVGLAPDSLQAADSRAAYTAPDSSRQQDSLLTLQTTRGLSGQARLALQAWHRQGWREGRTGDVSQDWRDWLAGCVGQGTAPACSDPSDPAYVASNAVINTSRSRQSETGLAAQWSRRQGVHSLVLGADAAVARVAHDQYEQDAMFDANRIAVPLQPGDGNHQVSLRGRTLRMGLFGADTLALRPGTQLSLSGRWDAARVRNDLGQPLPLTPEAFSYRKLNPALGLTQALGPRWTLFASASQGTRVPTALELGCADPARPCVLPTGLQSDPYLKPVVARTLETGARGDIGGVQVSGALFRTTNQDDVVFLRSGVSQAGYFANVDRTRRQGLELAAGARHRTVDWQAGYTLLDATYQSTLDLPGPLANAAQPNTVQPGSRMAGLPRHTLKLAADWRAVPGWTVGADWQLVGPQVVAGNESGSRPELGRLPGYAVVHGRVRWQASERWQLYLRVHNLFDRRHATYAAGNLDLFPAGRVVQAGDALSAARFVAPAAPRMLVAGLRYEWE